MQNKQWILNSFPMGEIKDNDLIFKDSNLNDIKDGEVLIKNIYLSLDPANRGWMVEKHLMLMQCKLVTLCEVAQLE